MSYSSKDDIRSMSDLELVAAYRHTEDKTFVGELYKRYAHLVLGMCVNYFRDREQAKDVMLAIFEKLFSELKKREIEHFKAWLTFVVRNFCISEIRKRQTEKSRSEEYCRDLETPSDDAEPVSEEKLEKLESALQELNPFQKTCIELFYYKNMSYQQIVALTGYSANEVKSYIQNGKRNLRQLLGS